MNTKTQYTNAASTRMEKAIAREIIRNTDGNDITSTLNDLAYGGCSSGTIGGMIYYHDTLKFYRTHCQEISALLKETMSDFGAKGVGEILRDWDTDDPLANDTHNQNLLAWFAFEETARRLADAIGLEI